MKKVSVLRNLAKNFCYDRKQYSLGVAMGRLYKDLPWGRWSRKQHYYEKCVLHFLNNKFNSVFEEYKSKPLYENTEHTGEEKHIWVMWWQGEDSMPPIVKKCWKSILDAANGVCVTLITRENYKEYIDISDEFVDRVESGKVCFANLSDLIRVVLIDSYGGLWIDATVLCQTKIAESFWDQDFYTLSSPGLFNVFISRGDWSPFLLYAQKGCTLFHALRICLETYYSKFDTPVDYLLIDYFMRVLIDNNPAYREALNSVPKCWDYYAINQMLNSTYNSESFQEAFKKCEFHKLTYKNIDYNNKKSVYSNLIGFNITGE